ncbi:PHD and RING finger domain-containing protein 1 [Spatholobus suberectus]|nr:PHD and RING finger domain-containing protein 1 [Spatholobus suberectus]
MSSSLGSPKKRLKSQVEENEEEGVCCGICYAERGVSIVGEIDCCNHYFCFVCIMEWAKHESRCPICRQRFSNVCRLPMHGVFSSSRDVKVPHRDQVYHPHGNVATGPVDSYAEANCSICHAGTEEHLLLLCDLCDTASHTYCVGLGYTVPEGDWFCHDCAISRETNTNEESDQQNVSPAAEPSATIDIFDIVRETGSRVVKRPRASPLQQNLSSPSVIPLSDRLSRFKGKSPVIGVPHMQRNIQSLRENWNALRSGSLRFCGNSFQPGSMVSQKQDSSSLSHCKVDDSHSMASSSLQQSTVQGGPSNKILNERVFKDVDKAWKMMDRAKRTQLTHQRTCSIPEGVDKPSCSGGARKTSSAHNNFLELKNQHSKALELRNTKKEKQCEYSRLNKNMENLWSLKLEEKKQGRVMHEEMIQHVRDHTTHSEGYCERPLSRKVHTSIQGVPCHEDGERNVAEEQSSSACLAPSADFASSRGKFGSVFFNRDVDLVNEEKRLATSFKEGNTRKIDDAKTEIQSLVKLNLKLLTRDKKLGVDTFKVVARQATHIILAACSSEQQKSSISSSSSVCSHSDQALQFQKSTLMPNCCRQCFYAFVNNVVNSIRLEKVGCA